MSFSQNLYDFCQSRNFFHKMDCSQRDIQNFSRENLWNCQIYVENLHCQLFLTLGLLSVYLVNKIQFRLYLYFEFFDLRFRNQKLHLSFKYKSGSLLWFYLSLSCQISFRSRFTAKFSQLCKSCKGVKIALNRPYITTRTISTF